VRLRTDSNSNLSAEYELITASSSCIIQRIGEVFVDNTSTTDRLTVKRILINGFYATCESDCFTA